VTGIIDRAADGTTCRPDGDAVVADADLDSDVALFDDDGDLASGHGFEFVDGHFAVCVAHVALLIRC